MARVSALSLAGVPLLAGSAVAIVVPLTTFVGVVFAIGSSVVGPELLIIDGAEGKFELTGFELTSPGGGVFEVLRASSMSCFSLIAALSPAFNVSASLQAERAAS
jgi:hypothetical protein